jgi:molybdopterin-guanine dinucleotide biosynthesis protein A
VWNGVSLLEHECRTALENTHRVLVVGRERPADFPLQEIIFLPDEAVGLGPLGGLKTALSWAQKEDLPAVLMLACDLPLLTSNALKWLGFSASFNASEHGSIVRNGEQMEPLFSLYNVSCLSLIERQLAQNKRSLHALIASGNFQFIDAPPEIASQLMNTNTPEDWRRAQAMNDQVERQS